MPAKNEAYDAKRDFPFFILAYPAFFILLVCVIMLRRHFAKKFAEGKRLTSNIDVGDVCWRAMLKIE